MLDTVSQYETPEGAALQLRPAGPVVRSLAWAIDLAIRGAILFALSMLLGYLGELGTGVFLVLLFLLEWFYNVPFEVLRGATPGKRRMGLQVVNDNGTPVGWSASLLRNLLRVVDFLPLFYGLGLIWSLFHPQGKRLGDLAAGTLVVYRETTVDYRLPDGLDSIVARSVPAALDYTTQQAVLGYAERASQLSEPRRVELAELFEPLHGMRGEGAVREMLGYAKTVAGKT